MNQGIGPTDIINIALRLLGDKGIASVSDQTPNAQLMNSLYDVTRDYLMRSFNWKFSIKRAQLSQLSGISIVQFKQLRLEQVTGRFVYGLPADYLRILETDQDPSPYKIESIVTNPTTQSQQLCLLSDQNQLAVRYISRITDTNLFDPNFIMAFAARLSAEAAIPITGNEKKAKLMGDVYQEKIREARLHGSFDDSDDVMQSTVLTTDVR
jgi:hypothetical protein